MQRVSLIDRIVSEIKDKIIIGEFKEGDIFPSQDELAKSMGVSRASLREAFNRLTLMGLIETKHGTGTFVKRATSIDIINSLSSLLIMDRASASELLHARLHIEPAVAALAAKNATKEDIDKIKVQLKGMVNDFDLGDIKNFISRDVQFHILISKSSKNRVLAKIVEIIREILRQFIKKYFESQPLSMSDAIKYHKSIFSAIERHDPKAAQKHMGDHLTSLLVKISEKELTW